MNITQIENDLYTVLSNNTTAPVILENQDGPRPNVDYVSFKVVNISQEGRGEEEILDAGVVLEVKAHYNISVRVTGYGPTAKTLISDLQLLITNADPVGDEFLSFGLAISGVPSINDTPVLRDTGWEEISGLDLNFHFAERKALSVGYIAHVTLDESYKDATGTVIVQQTTTIDSE